MFIVNDQKFYDKGLKFECQGSGNCCTSRGEYGYVYLTKEDRQNLAKALNMTTSGFTRKYCARHNGIWHLKADNSQADCLFLKNKRCEVYKARPVQCRTWPFWPEVLNAKSWSKEVASFCPGVGKGRVWTAAEIQKIADQDAENTSRFGT